MFQNSSRFYTLLLRAQYLVKHGIYFDELIENIVSLEVLVRTERQAAELELLIEQAGDAFGFCMEDELEFIRG